MRGYIADAHATDLALALHDGAQLVGFHVVLWCAKGDNEVVNGVRVNVSDGTVCGELAAVCVLVSKND